MTSTQPLVTSGMPGTDRGLATADEPDDESLPRSDRTWSRALIEGARRRPVLTVFLVALSVRFIAAVVLALLGRVESVAPDVRGFTDLAAQMADGASGWTDEQSFFYREFATYLVPLTGLFWLFGEHVLLGQILAAVFGAGAAAGIAGLAARILDRRWALGVGLVAALMPSYVLWSSVALRDGPVWSVTIALALVAAAGLRARGRELLWLGVAGAVLVYLMGHLRWPTTIVVAWALVAAMAFSVRTGRFLRVAGALLIALVVPWSVDLGIGGFEYALSRNLSAMRAENAVGADSAVVDPVPVTALGGPDAAADAGGSGGLAFDDGGLTTNISYLPKGLRVMLLEPLPWTSDGDFRTRLVQLEMVIWYPLLALAVVGTVFVVRRRIREMAFPVIAGAIVLATYALAEGNLGTAYRHRSEFFYAVVLLAALGLHDLSARRRERRVDVRVLEGDRF